MPRRASRTNDSVKGGMTVPSRLVQLLTVAAFTGLALPLATASLLRAMDLATLTAGADQIVIGEVLSAESTWDGEHRSIYSTIEIGVQESWKGSLPTNGRIRIRQLGGRVGQVEMTVVGMPRFTRGERALVFLRREQVVGMSQGKRTLRWDSASRSWMVDAPDRAGALKVAFRGDPRSLEPLQGESLDHLRERIRALVRD